MQEVAWPGAWVGLKGVGCWLIYSQVCVFFLIKVECRGGNERKMLIHRGEASKSGG